MGKGKGSPLLWIYKPILNKPLAILGGVNILRAHAVLNYFKKNLTPWIYIKKI